MEKLPYDAQIVRVVEAPQPPPRKARYEWLKELGKKLGEGQAIQLKCPERFTMRSLICSWAQLCKVWKVKSYHSTKQVGDLIYLYLWKGG